MEENYLHILQSLIDEERDEPIQYTDIKYAFRNTTINQNSYYTFYNSLLVCLKELWEIHYSHKKKQKEFKEFILKNQKMLIDYAQSELNSILTTLQCTLERYHNGEVFQYIPLFEQEIQNNITIITEIITVSNFVFNDIQWLNIPSFVKNIEIILNGLCHTSQYYKFNDAYNEWMILIHYDTTVSTIVTNDNVSLRLFYVFILYMFTCILLNYMNPL